VTGAARPLAVVPRRIGPARLVATMGGIGLARPFPGTWGSMLVLPAVLLGPLPCLLLAGLVLALGWWATQAVLRESGQDDPGWIVVDEGAGQLLTLAALPPDPTATGLLMAFVLFRALDILKVWPVSWADRQPGALGVMLDEVFAGIIGGVGLMAFARFHPGVLG
jgi:phosphatidylglycerophosphatase A